MRAKETPPQFRDVNKQQQPEVGKTFPISWLQHSDFLIILNNDHDARHQLLLIPKGTRTAKQPPKSKQWQNLHFQILRKSDPT